MKSLTIPLLALFLLAGCTSLPPDEGPQPFDDSDRQLEKEIAAQGEAQIREQLKPLANPYVQGYVSRVGRRIAAVTDRPDLAWTFQVIDDDQMNAFTIGDGKIWFFKGLLTRLENEAQLAAVMAHEMGHVTRFHTVLTARQAMETNMVVGVAAAALGGSELVNLAAGVAGSILSSGFSREMEDQADRLALKYMVDAGYDPREFPKVFEIFQREMGDAPQLYNDLFGDHSTNAERITASRALIAERYALGLSGKEVGEAAYRQMQQQLR